MPKIIQVQTTTETKEQAEAIARQLVERRLAGCVQVFGPIASTYWWKGEVQHSEEWFCLIKARQEDFGQLERDLKEIHPYEVPEILVIPVEGGGKPYLDWLERETVRK